MELYAYLKARRSLRGAETRKSDLRATLHRLVEYEHSYPPDSSGILLEEGHPSAPRGTDYSTQQGRALRQLLEEKAREYQFCDSTYALPIKSTADKRKVADVLGVSVDIINKMRTDYPSYFRGDTLEIRGLVQLVIDYVEQMNMPLQPIAKLQRLTLYLDSIAAFASRIGESGPATDSGNRRGKDSKTHPMQAIVEGLEFDPKYRRVEAYVRGEFPDDPLALQLTAELIQRGAQGINWAYIGDLSRRLGVQSGRITDTLEALYSGGVVSKGLNKFKLNPQIATLTQA